MRVMTRWTWLLPLLLAGCGHKQAAPPELGPGGDAPLPVVQVVPVTTGTLERTLPATGILMALRDREATLSPPVAGVLDELPIRYGQSVRTGQVIAHLSTRQLQGQIQQAQATIGQNLVQVQQAQANAIQQQAQTRTAILQAQSAVSGAAATLSGARATLFGDEAALHNAEQTLARQKTLLAEGLVAQKDVEAAELAVRTAQAQADAQRQTVAAQAQTVAGQRQAVAAARAASLQDVVKRQDVQVARQQVQNARGALATARAQVALYTVRAPLSGQVTQVGAATGETVDTATKLATIADLSTLQLQISLPGSAARQVRPGQPVTFSVSSLPGETLRTTVSTVAAQVDAATGTVPVFATVANPRRLLRDDSTAKVQIVTERRPNVLLVPQAALLTDPDTGKTSVAVVGEDGVAHVTEVKTGLSAGGRVEITDGVKAGQKVAVAGQYGLPDGAKVRVRNAKSSPPAPTRAPLDVQGAGTPGVQPPTEQTPSPSASPSGGKPNGP
ncbi:MAG: efflux RND transporter periplasmic adaptor subunit [Armatimonadetes bacterium]|nr:efflux RND transporter periplasmic adaptor subunit [Armatimonadota bacterium]